MAVYGVEVKVASSKTPTLECFNPNSFLVVSNVFGISSTKRGLDA